MSRAKRHLLSVICSALSMLPAYSAIEASNPDPAGSAPVPAPDFHGSLPAPAPANMAPAPGVPTPLPGAGVNENSGAHSPADDEQIVANNLKADLGAISALSLPAWEGQSSVWLSRIKGSLQASEGVQFPESIGASRNVLLEYGCTDLVSRTFKRDGLLCQVDVYHFAKPEGAYGAYSILREGSSTVVVRGQASSEDDICISFWKGNVFAKLKVISGESDEAKQALSKFADQLVSRVTGSAELPFVLRILPSFEKVKGSEKFFMGIDAAQRYLNVPFVEALYLAGSDGAAHADYQFASPLSERLGLLAINYKTPALAQSSFKSYVDNITVMSNKVLQRSETEALCRVSDSFLLCQLNGQRLYVITGARRKFTPAMLARQLH